MTSFTKFYKGKNSQLASFTENPDCNFFIAQDYHYIHENIKKVSKHYACFNTINDFFEFESALPDNKKTCYETLKDERIEIYDIDGEYTSPIFQTSSGEPASDQEIIAEFIDARLDFQEETYPEIKLHRNDFLIKKTDDPNNKKISFHFIVRNGFKFKDEKHLKTHTKKFNDYCKDIYKVKIDMSIYSKNRLIRCLGHHKLGQDKRFSYRYKEHSIYNENCNRKLFFASYLEGDEQYYPDFVEIKKEVDEDFVSAINLTHTQMPSDYTITCLVNLICETIDMSTSPICDEEITNKLNYDKWYRLVITVFNCCSDDCTHDEGHYGDDTSVRLYKKLFQYYRHCKDIDEDKYYADLSSKKGEYTSLTINSLHYLARFNDKYKDRFEKEITEFNEKLKLLRYKRSLKQALKSETSNTYPINYISQMTTLHGITHNQHITLKHIESTVNKIISNITNGGENSIFCLDRYYCNNSKTTLETYKQTSFSKLISSSGALQIVIRYINITYEKDLQKYNKDFENSTPAQQKKLILPKMYHQNILGQVLGAGVVADMLSHNKLTHYSRPVFIPHLHSTDKHLENYKDCLNLFLGFPFKTNNVSPELYKNSLLRENLRKHLCNGDVEPANFTFIEQHTAHMLQKPYERADMAIIMTGSQGTGKDLWCTHLSKLIGLEYFLDVASISILFKDFNASQGRKLLIKMNEISDKGDNFDKHNQLKEKITATRTRVEPKGFDAYFIDNFARYYGFSQHDNVVVVENTDRRFFMIKTNNEKANNQEYFAKIVKESEDPEMLQSSFNYYATLDISDFNPRIFPNTDYREEQKIQSLPNDIKFFYYIFENNKETTIDMKYTKSVSDIFLEYCSWCVENNIKMTNTKLNFSKDIKKLGITIIPRLQIGTQRVAGISITHQELEDVFKLYMKNDKFVLPKYS
jgi:hypothetical protein